MLQAGISNGFDYRRRAATTTHTATAMNTFANNMHSQLHNANTQPKYADIFITLNSYGVLSLHPLEQRVSKRDRERGGERISYARRSIELIR